MYVSEERVPLEEPCDLDDICADDFAQCRAGFCKCRDDYYNNNGVCRELRGSLLFCCNAEIMTNEAILAPLQFTQSAIAICNCTSLGDL